MSEKFLSRQLFNVEEQSGSDKKHHRLVDYIIPFFNTLLREIKTREANRSTKVMLKNSAKRALKKLHQENSREIVELVLLIAQLDGNSQLDANQAINSLQKQLDIFDRYAQMLRYEIYNEA